MERRVLTLDEYINESKLISEASFDWDAKTLAKVRQSTPDDMEITLWVTISNLFNIFNLSPVFDAVDKHIIVGKIKGKFIGASADNDKGMINFYCAIPEDPTAFEKEIKDMNPVGWPDNDNKIKIETISYNPEKLNVKAEAKKIDKILKRFVYVLK